MNEYDDESHHNDTILWPNSTESICSGGTCLCDAHTDCDRTVGDDVMTTGDWLLVTGWWKDRQHPPSKLLCSLEGTRYCCTFIILIIFFIFLKTQSTIILAKKRPEEIIFKYGRLSQITSKFHKKELWWSVSHQFAATTVILFNVNATTQIRLFSGEKVVSGSFGELL